MNSEQRAYVYLQRPRSLDVVTAGRYTLVSRDGVAVGRFLYNPAYLDDQRAVPLDPFTLPLQSKPFETVKLRGMFGALRDAAPDSWGRRIIERELARTDLTELDFLLQSPDDRAGALSFGHGKEPPAPFRAYNPVIQLEALLMLAEQVQADDGALDTHPQAAQVEGLLRPDTAMGGARPKNVVEDEDGLWIAKFPERGDRWSNARIERAMLELARECGINSATSKVITVGHADVILVKRFDRERTAGGYLRTRMLSGLTLLDVEDTYESRGAWSYLALADEVRRRSNHSKRDLEELFRRMTFNALISNSDDHPRNHAMIAPGEDFMLSPAYDLTPNPQVSTEKRDLAMTAGSWNRYANRENLISGHARFLLTQGEATHIVDSTRGVVQARWRAVLKTHGTSEPDIERVSGAFDYPGFMLDPHKIQPPADAPRAATLRAK
jgi:serine/threonine-protein kinase HipA